VDTVIDSDEFEDDIQATANALSRLTPSGLLSFGAYPAFVQWACVYVCCILKASTDLAPARSYPAGAHA